MSDTIFIKGLLMHARHGLLDHEAAVGQRFVVDLEMAIDLESSSRSDKLSDTVSYSDVVATASEAFKGQNYYLLERAAGAVAEAVLRDFARIEEITVTVHKPHAPIPAIFEDVGVIITRRRG